MCVGAFLSYSIWVKFCVSTHRPVGAIFRRIGKLLKATISFAMPVCLSARTEHLGTHWTDFDEISYLRLFRKFIEKIPVSLKSDKNNGQFTRRRFYS